MREMREICWKKFSLWEICFFVCQKIFSFLCSYSFEIFTTFFFIFFYRNKEERENKKVILALYNYMWAYNPWRLEDYRYLFDQVFFYFMYLKSIDIFQIPNRRRSRFFFFYIENTRHNRVQINYHFFLFKTRQYIFIVSIYHKYINFIK